MEELKLHSFGQKEHIESLKKKYNSLKKKIKENKKLTDLQKNTELKSLTESFEKEKKESQNNLY